MSEHTLKQYFKWIFIFSAIMTVISFVMMFFPFYGYSETLTWNEAVTRIATPFANVLSFLLSILTFSLFINLLFIKKNAMLKVYFWISFFLILARSGNVTSTILSIIIRSFSDISTQHLLASVLIIEIVFSILTTAIALIGSEMALRYGVEDNYAKNASKIAKPLLHKEEVSNDTYIENNKDYKALIIKIDALLAEGKITKQQYNEIKERFEIQLLQERNKKWEEKHEK